jgi:hypothetical protein
VRRTKAEGRGGEEGIPGREEEEDERGEGAEAEEEAPLATGFGWMKAVGENPASMEGG